MWKDFFSFSSKEKAGFMVLISLIVLIICANNLIRHFFMEKNEFNYNNEAYCAFLNELEERKLPGKFKSEPLKNEEANGKQVNNFFKFDPNELTKESWMSLNFSAKQAEVILNYKKRIGRFKQAEDLKKIYVIDDQKYNELKPYILFKKEKTVEIDSYSEPESPVAKSLINLNLADTVDLKTISGVGDVFAERIYKYGKLLGGYYTKEQLLEVYGIDSLKFMEIEHQVSVDSSCLKKLDINTMEFKELLKHPYLDYKTLKKISDYKKVVGFIKSSDELIDNYIVEKEKMNKLKPYLKLK